jgi:hypothetical protein
MPPNYQITPVSSITGIVSQQFRNFELVVVTPEEKCPENTEVCRSRVKETLAGHFPRGLKSLESRESGGIPQDSSGW